MKKLNDKQLEKVLASKDLHDLILNNELQFGSKRFHKHGIIILMKSAKHFKTLVEKYKKYSIEVISFNNFGGVNKVIFRYWILGGICHCKKNVLFPVVPELTKYKGVDSKQAVNCDKNTRLIYYWDGYLNS